MGACSVKVEKKNSDEQMVAQDKKDLEMLAAEEEIIFATERKSC
jgi:hypothetical protein